MFERVIYEVSYSYLVANQRGDWRRLEALISEKLSELSHTFIPVRLVLFRDQRGYDVSGGSGGEAVLDDNHYEEAFDWAWDQMAEEA